MQSPLFLIHSKRTSQRESKSLLLYCRDDIELLLNTWCINTWCIIFWHKIPCMNLHSTRPLTHGQCLISLKENRHKMKGIHMSTAEVRTHGKNAPEGCQTNEVAGYTRPTQKNYRASCEKTLGRSYCYLQRAAK